ncbi:MAG: dTDP-4-dehydrorhamnose reductase, partial [Lentisphaerae bacterium]|nr:dTDP-4-dehydrorhamnose reductase [Lentisphaerota bacterium]
VEAALAQAAVVVNCAAYTNVDKAEEQPEVARAVNAEAVGVLGRLARQRGTYVVHISTDFVFDGKGDRPYVETDTPRPLNVYGDSKWKGELALQASGCDHAILRVEWSYGRHGVHFIAKLLERAHTGVDLKVVDDQIGAPTWTADAARAILCLLRGRHTGLYHFASGGFVSRYDMARFVLQAFDLQNRISPCSSETFPMKAVRPKNSRFNTAKIQPLLDHPIRDWQTALSEFLSHGGLTPTPQ